MVEEFKKLVGVELTEKSFFSAIKKYLRLSTKRDPSSDKKIGAIAIKQQPLGTFLCV